MTYILTMLILLSVPTPGDAHPGRKSKDGCHYCWSNCEKRGVVRGARHSHNGQPCSSQKTSTKQAPTKQTQFSAQVVGVSDGDTITVLTSEKTSVKIRLYGIDTPEQYQDFGAKAKEYTSEKLFNKNVHVEVIDTDRYGRQVALVSTPDEPTHNEQAVRDGFAWVYDQYCKRVVCKEWKKLESKAKENKTGLWSHKQPIAPWSFRRMKSSR